MNDIAMSPFNLSLPPQTDAAGRKHAVHADAHSGTRENFAGQLAREKDRPAPFQPGLPLTPGHLATPPGRPVDELVVPPRHFSEQQSESFLPPGSPGHREIHPAPVPINNDWPIIETGETESFLPPGSPGHREIHPAPVPFNNDWPIIETGETESFLPPGSPGHREIHPSLSLFSPYSNWKWSPHSLEVSI